MQLDGTELTSYYFPSRSPPSICTIVKLAFRQGLDISGTALRNDFCHRADRERR